jgi:hypothetical protein
MDVTRIWLFIWWVGGGRGPSPYEVMYRPELVGEKGVKNFPLGLIRAPTQSLA